MVGAAVAFTGAMAARLLAQRASGEYRLLLARGVAVIFPGVAVLSPGTRSRLGGGRRSAGMIGAREGWSG